MRTVFAYQFRRIRTATALILLCLWSLLALFVYTAMVQYGEKDCWFLVFRVVQVLLPVAAVLPLSVWIDPYLSAQSAELLHSLPESYRLLSRTLGLFLPVLWLCTVALPIGAMWLVLPEFSLLHALVRFSAQALFCQALFLVSGAILHSTLNGMAVFLVADGAMLLSLKLPAVEGTVFQTVNLFESFSFVNQESFSPEKSVLILALSVLLFAVFKHRIYHFFENK